MPDDLPSQGDPALPDAAGHDGKLRLVDSISAYLAPSTIIIFAAVAAIFILCLLMWNIAWLRPYVVAGGAGLAAFLGPIPGIVTPESRSKWLISILVAAAITAGTWLATQDLEDKLGVARQELVDQRLAASTARERDVAHDGLVTRILIGTPEALRAPLYISAANQLWSVYNDKRKANVALDDADFHAIRETALMLLELDRNNGHGLYYAAESSAKLGDFPEMVRMLQHFLAAAPNFPAEANSGEAAECYKRASGFCAERVGWVSHMLSDYYLMEALRAPDAERGEILTRSLDYQMKAVTIEKWPPAHHHSGFDSGGLTKGNSSCKILQTIAKEQLRLGIDPAPVVLFGQEQLADHCGKWPEAN